MTPPDPLPLLDEQAVEAAADEFRRCRLRNLSTQAAAESAGHILAAYFAALDREALVERVALATEPWVTGRAADGNLSSWTRDARDIAKSALAALGLFTPDTKEPT